MTSWDMQFCSRSTHSERIRLRLSFSCSSFKSHLCLSHFIFEFSHVEKMKTNKKEAGIRSIFFVAREIWRTLVWKPNFDLIKAKSKLSAAVEGVLVPISIFQYPAKFNSYLIQIFPSAKVKSWKTIEKTFYFNRFQTKKVSLGIE